MHKKYSAKSVWGHPFSTYVSHDRFLTPLHLYASIHILDDSPPFPQSRKYVMDVLFFNQQTNNNIRISYSVKYKHSEKNKFFKSHTCPVILHYLSLKWHYFFDRTKLKFVWIKITTFFKRCVSIML